MQLAGNRLSRSIRAAEDFLLGRRSGLAEILNDPEGRIVWHRPSAARRPLPSDGRMLKHDRQLLKHDRQR